MCSILRDVESNTVRLKNTDTGLDVLVVEKVRVRAPNVCTASVLNTPPQQR
jgi:hypothetical protein